MEALFAHCASFVSSSYPLWISVFVAGLVGSLSHCSFMCAPLVAAQTLQLEGQKAPRSTIHSYHAGRMTTYATLGGMAVLLSHMLFSGKVQPYADGLLMIAGVTFITSALFPRNTHGCGPAQNSRVMRWVNETLSDMRLVLYVRGLMMGFMPCGMVYAVLLTAATLEHPLEGMAVMMMFGLATTPLLQLASVGSLKLNRRHPRFSTTAGRSVMAINGLFLCGLGLNLISMH